jgi:hypothetical protein
MAVAKSREFIFAYDDRAARRDAGLLNVKLTGTLGAPNKAMRHKTIDLNRDSIILTRMIEIGFYSPVKSLNDPKRGALIPHPLSLPISAMTWSNLDKKGQALTSIVSGR